MNPSHPSPAAATPVAEVPAGTFLVAGCGSIGKRHLRNLARLGVSRLAAFDPRADRRAEVEGELGARTYASYEEALAARPRAVLVCAPTHLHLEQALLAARAGCHLFIEKPVADRLEGLAELEALLAERRLHSLVGCNFRFHPGLRHAKALLDEGAIGRVVSARAQFGQYLPDWHPYEDYRQGYSARRAMGGGVILDRIHELDYLRFLLGEVTELQAFSGHLSGIEIETEDTAEMILRFASGALGSAHVDYVRRTYDCSLEIVGDGGTIQWRYQDHSLRYYLAAEARWHALEWPKYDGNEMYLAELRHFFRVLDGREASEQDVAAGRTLLALALAARDGAGARRDRP